MTRFGSRIDRKACKRLQFHTALFLSPCDSPGGLYAGAFGLAGVLSGRSSNRVWPAFLFGSEKADLFNPFTERRFAMSNYPANVSTLSTSNKEPLLTVIDGTVKTTSLNIAENFQKEHSKVLRAIKTLECPEDFIQANFGLNKYTDSIGRKLPMYELTRDGFTILAMGFTGKKAMEWKVRYINGFNLMEKRLLEHQRKAFAPPAGLTPAQQRQVQHLVKERAWAMTEGKPGKAEYQRIYGSIKDHFLVGTYSQVPQARFDELVRFLGGESGRIKALPMPDISSVKGRSLKLNAIGCGLSLESATKDAAGIRKEIEQVLWWLDSLDVSLGSGNSSAGRLREAAGIE